MSLVRAKDTKAEMRVRKIFHSLGYRYRLHIRDLPGCPDLVVRRRKKAIFVHGCFWHQHNCSMGNRMPKTRIDFWREKLDGNKKRDVENIRLLMDHGWSVLVIWECETKPSNLGDLASRIVSFMECPSQLASM